MLYTPQRLLQRETGKESAESPHTCFHSALCYTPRATHRESQLILAALKDVGAIHGSILQIGKLRQMANDLSEVFRQMLTEYLLFAVDGAHLLWEQQVIG